MAGSPKKRARRAAQAAQAEPLPTNAPGMPAPPSLPVKRGPGRPRKHPLPTGTAPMQPPPLPPHPGPADANTARAVDDAHAAAPMLEDAAPVGLDAAGLVTLVAEVRSIALSTYAMLQRAQFDTGELEALCELAPSKRRTLEAFAPAALPWVNANLPNAGGFGIALFGITALFSCVEPMREIKRRAPRRDAAAPPPGVDPERVEPSKGPLVKAEHVQGVQFPEPARESEALQWHGEVGATQPASPGT